MTLTLLLEPQEEAKLVAVARSNGLSRTHWCERLSKEFSRKPRIRLPLRSRLESLRGLLAKYGRGPSVEEIDQNRVEMFGDFPRSDS